MNQISQQGWVFLFILLVCLPKGSCSFLKIKLLVGKKVRKIQMSYADQLKPGTFYGL